MADAGTQIDLIVGSLLVTSPDDESHDDEREWIGAVQSLLRDEGIETDLLARPGEKIWTGEIAGFGDLYELRRLAAHIAVGGDLRAIASAPLGDEEEDRVLAAVLEDEQDTRFPHLIKHRGPGGFYLPADFAEPLWVEAEHEDGGEDEAEEEEDVTSFGSSVALARELAELRGELDRAGVDQPEIRAALDSLSEAAAQSTRNGVPLTLW